MAELRYDVFEVDGASAFEIVSDEELRTGNLGPLIDDAAGQAVKIVHAVPAATAAELVGLNGVPKGVEGFTDPLVWLESHVAEFGSLATVNSDGEYEVRRSSDDG
jgi:hypothetical protein